MFSQERLTQTTKFPQKHRLKRPVLENEERKCVRKAEAELTSQIGLGLPLKRFTGSKGENSKQKPRGKNEARNAGGVAPAAVPGYL
jgi:hypothetical protein